MSAESVTLRAVFNEMFHVVLAMFVTVATVFAFAELGASTIAGVPHAAVENTSVPAFAVVSIRQNERVDGRWKIKLTSDGLIATGVTTRQLIQEAYGLFESDRILWKGVGEFPQQRFDIEAKVDDADIPKLRDLDYDQRRLMLKALLIDRFNLTAHWETKERPVLAMVVAKRRPRLRESQPNPAAPGTMKGMGGLVKRGAPHLIVEGGTMPSLARTLSIDLGRTVLDKTGLVARYDYELDWTEDLSPTADKPSEGVFQPSDAIASDPSIFTAIQEQLGLKLESQKAPVEILIIDHIEPPSAN